MASKIVLITGSNKGIGFGIAKLLLERAPEFSTIILTARNPELGLAARAELGHEERTVFHQLDVTSQPSIQALAAFVAGNFGKIDVLVNNAGWAAKGDAFDHEIVYQTISTNFYGVKNLTEALLPLLNANGHIVNISSNLGETSWLNNPALALRFLDPELTQDGVVALAEEFINRVKEGTWTQHGWPTFGYAVSKNLLNSYSRILAKDFEKNGVSLRVNAVHPGWVRTDMAGQEAELSIEEGSELPVRVIRDTTGITGKFWSNGNHYDYF